MCSQGPRGDYIKEGNWKRQPLTEISVLAILVHELERPGRITSLVQKLRLLFFDVVACFVLFYLPMLNLSFHLKTTERQLRNVFLPQSAAPEVKASTSETS